jgi:hypothetical protein
MIMLGVIPVEKALAMLARVLNRAEPLGKRRPILERFELRLGIGVIIGDRRTAMG